LRIGIVSGAPPTCGLGVNFQAYYPARELAKLGHQIDWLCPAANPDRAYELPEPLGSNVNVEELTPYAFLVWNPFVHISYRVSQRIGAMAGIKDMIDLFRSPGGFIPQLMGRIAKRPPDIIHAMPFPFSHCWFAARAAEKHRIPYVVSPYFNIGSAPYYNRFLREALLGANVVHVTTEAERQEVVRLGVVKTRTRLVPNAVDLSEWKSADGQRFRCVMRLEDKKIVLFPGRKEPGKGAILALEAMRRVVQQRNDTTFIAAGHDTPEWKRALGMGNNRRILSLPYQTGTARLDMFAAADVVLLPSKVDASPTVFLEAWAVRKPVVGVRSPAARDFIADGRDGLLAEVDDPSSLAATVEGLLDDQKLREELGARGYARVAGLHDWRMVISDWIRMYNDARGSCIS